jgi:hypothetical protein
VVDPGPIIRKVFTPLVTAKGRAELSTFLKGLSDVFPRTGHAAVSLLDPARLP